MERRAVGDYDEGELKKTVSSQLPVATGRKLQATSYRLLVTGYSLLAENRMNP